MKQKKVNASRVPLYREAGFHLHDSETTRQAFEAEKMQPHEPDQYIYSRYRNPTVVAAEKEIMRLERSQWALLFETGMAAIDTAVSLFQKGKETRPWLFFHEIYGGTNSFIDGILIDKRGLDVRRFYAENGQYNLDELEAIILKLKPEFLYFEAVSNPMLIVADVERIMKLAHRTGTKTIIDNTFGTPLLWRPLEDGATLVIHSVTKYLSGHGSITAGVLCGNDPVLFREAIEYRKWAGHFLSPDDAHRLIDQLKTFEIRFKQHCANAQALADFLEHHPAIEKVLYPGLTTHPTYPEAKKLFKDRGYGGMITFELKGADEADQREKTNQLVRALEAFVPLVPTLGEADSILLPIEPVWGAKYPEPGMIRLSVGIENTDELLDVFRKALDF